MRKNDISPVNMVIRVLFFCYGLVNALEILQVLLCLWNIMMSSMNT